MMALPTPSLQVLLAEDSDEDAFFFEHALQATNLNAFLARVENGLQAIAYMRAIPPFSDRLAYPFPDMIVTDLKMPQSDGFEFLAWLKNNPSCKIIPTVVLSSSYVEDDVAHAYQLGANAFLTKPGTLLELKDLLLLTHMFWSRCQRPPKPPNLKCD